MRDVSLGPDNEMYRGTTSPNSGGVSKPVRRSIDRSNEA